MSRARRFALRFLAEVAAGRHVDTLSRKREFSELSAPDRAFAHELVYGCLRRQRLLDYLLARLCSKPLERLDPEVLLVLRMGAYQVRFLRVPEHAAVHTSVELVRRAGFSSARGLVNAVLRNLIRKPPELPSGEGVEALSIRHSHPAWLVARSLERWGLEKALHWMEQNNQPPQGVFWVNPRFGSPESFVDQMRQQDPEARVHHELPQAVYLNPSVKLPEAMPEAGFFMDEGSQRIVFRQLPEQVRNCVDLCAAPGGKSFLLACELPAQAQLVLTDRSRRRLLQLRKRASALGFGRLNQLLQCDAAAAPFSPGAFDFLLLDVPCSGLGTIRSNPDIRWRIEPADLNRFQALQVAMLRQAVKLTRPGGRIVYSTCSTEPEENQEVVESVKESSGKVQLEETWANFPGERSGDCFFRATLKRL